MEVFVVMSTDEGFYTDIEEVFFKREDAENYLIIHSNDEKEFSIQRSILK